MSATDCQNIVRAREHLDVLHDLGKAHSFVDTRNSKRKVLHHPAHHSVLVGWVSSELCERIGKSVSLTLFDHLLDGARGVDFHGKQVVKPVDLGRVLGELLTKSVGEVVSRVRRLRSSALCQSNELPCKR